MNDQKTKLPPLPAHTISGPAGTGDYFNGHTDAAMTEFGQACYAAALADQAGEQKPVSVEVKRNRVWIVSGVQSFMLAYEADTDEELQWYAEQLRTAMSGITPDVKSDEQKPAMSDLIAQHQTPKAKAMAELTQGEQKPEAWLRDNGKQCVIDAEKTRMANSDYGLWPEVAAQYTTPLYTRPQPADERLREALEALFMAMGVSDKQATHILMPRALTPALKDAIDPKWCYMPESMWADMVAAQERVGGGQASDGWQPIETAPKDGSAILLGRAEDEENDRAAISTLGRWHDEDHDGPDNMGHDAGFMDDEFQQFSWGRSFGNSAYMSKGFQPTHWRPLPAAPIAAERAAGEQSQ